MLNIQCIKLMMNLYMVMNCKYTIIITTCLHNIIHLEYFNTLPNQYIMLELPKHESANKTVGESLLNIIQRLCTKYLI